MPSSTDITIKHVTKGNLAGKLFMYFISDKAKSTYKSLGQDDTTYILMFEAKENTMQKAEEFCTRNQLHYDLVIQS